MMLYDVIMQGCGFDPWVRKIPWRRAWQLSILAWRITTDRGAWWAIGCPQRHRESDTTEVT